MGRPSNRDLRRAEILTAFAHVLAQHGYAGATIHAIAARAGIAPGLVHHHFRDKSELMSALLDQLVAASRSRTHDAQGDFLDAYIDGMLALNARADAVAARCWVGLFAESLRDPSALAKMKRVLDAELGRIERTSSLDSHGASALLAFVVGSLVLGAFAPQRTRGFAAPAARTLVRALRSPQGATQSSPE